MYYIFFSIALACFAFHTIVHLLKKENKIFYSVVGIAMFLAWFSYFFMSFSDPNPMHFFGLNYLGFFPLMVGIYLFFASNTRVHKRMHSGKGNLITGGVYKHLRHPMYLGEILMLLSVPIIGQSLLTLFLSPIFIIQILIWRYLEEKELMAEFPGYCEYKKRTWF